MAKSRNQKAKILYLMDFFQNETDREHPLTRKQLEEKLGDLGIHAERKSLYDDIATLKLFGMNIVYKKERPEGYYLADREFELPELEMLIQAVESCEFFQDWQKEALIEKVEKLAGRYGAWILEEERQGRL